MRWLLLEEIESIEKGRLARSRSKIPDSPIRSEFLLTEMMAQTGGVLVGAERDFREDVVFAKIESAVFESLPPSGSVITIEAEADGLREEGGWLEGRVIAGDRIIARSRFLLMNVGHLRPGINESITFHSIFMEHFRVREKLDQSSHAAPPSRA